MNFTTKIWESVDLNWGTLKDGKWTGMLGMIKRNEVEVAIADISMNPDRGANFDFTDPVLEVKSYAYVPMAGNSVNWTMFLELLHWTVWLSLVSLLIILPTVWKAFQLWEFQDKESFSVIFQGCFTLLIQQGKFKPRSHCRFKLSLEKFQIIHLIHPTFHKESYLLPWQPLVLFSLSTIAVILRPSLPPRLSNCHLQISMISTITQITKLVP